MKRVVMAGWLQRFGHDETYDKDFTEAKAAVVQDGAPTLVMQRLVVAGYPAQCARATTAHLFKAVRPDALTPKEGDTVRFRYTPNLHTVVSVTDNPQGPIAVLHRYDNHGLPLGGFAVRADDLRIVKRRPADDYDDGRCCTGGDCCGPGSWCCTRAGRHEHPDMDNPPTTR